MVESPMYRGNLEMDFAPIVDRDADGNVKLMDARIFKDEVMGMTIE